MEDVFTNIKFAKNLFKKESIEKYKSLSVVVIAAGCGWLYVAEKKYLKNSQDFHNGSIVVKEIFT